MQNSQETHDNKPIPNDNTTAASATQRSKSTSSVDRRLKREILMKKMREKLEDRRSRIVKAEAETKRLEEEVSRSQEKIEEERMELSKACDKLRKEFPDLLGTLCFNPNGTNLNELLGVADARGLATELRTKRRHAEQELEFVRAELVEFNNRIESSQTEIASKKKEHKQLNAEKKRVSQQVEDVRKSSSVIRDIHATEEVIATYKQRQEKAESTKRSLESEWEAKLRDYEIDLTKHASKKEEVEVMIQLERVEHKKTIERTAALVSKMTRKISHESQYILKASELATNDSCPIFQLPLKRQLCPQVEGA